MNDLLIVCESQKSRILFVPREEFETMKENGESV